MATPALPDRPVMFWLKVLAVLINGFSIVVVNIWIFRAIARFMKYHAEDYGRPPTISRAISDPVIGEPFEFWITLSAVFLAIGVGVLILHYYRLMRLLPQPSRYLWISLAIVMPVMFLLQISSSVGMHILSAFRMPEASEMHMVGSFQFFGSQALVVIGFTMVNHALLRDRNALEILHLQGVLDRSLVKTRFWVGAATVSLVLAYLGLFLAKDIWTSDIAPNLYWTYTKTEPVVISFFLLVLALCHIDLFGRRWGR